MGSYSYMWWVNLDREDGTRLMPDVPPDAFFAVGHGHRSMMAVIPSKGIVVSWNEGIPQTFALGMYDVGGEVLNEAFKMLLDALEN